MTTKDTNPRPDGHAAEPLALRLNDQLGPLVAAEMAEFRDGAYAKTSDAEAQLWGFARAVQSAERARCRDLVRRYMPAGWTALYDAIGA